MQSFYTIQKHEESVVYMERKIKRTKKTNFYHLAHHVAATSHKNWTQTFKIH